MAFDPRSRGPSPERKSRSPTRRAWGYGPTGSAAFEDSTDDLRASFIPLPSSLTPSRSREGAGGGFLLNPSHLWGGGGGRVGLFLRACAATGRGPCAACPFPNAHDM